MTEQAAYFCAICGNCDGSKPHTYEELQAMWTAHWNGIYPELQAMYDDAMTNINQILERVRLRGAIMNTLEMNLI